MLGEFLSYEDSAARCQERCHRIPRCAYFTFYKDLRMCHVTDDSAMEQLGSIGVLSGPAHCLPSSQQEIAVKYGVWSSMQVGGPGAAPASALAGHAAAALAAGSLCALFAAAARHFVTQRSMSGRSMQSDYLAPDGVGETALVRRSE